MRLRIPPATPESGASSTSYRSDGRRFPEPARRPSKRRALPPLGREAFARTRARSDRRADRSRRSIPPAEAVSKQAACVEPISNRHRTEIEAAGGTIPHRRLRSGRRPCAEPRARAFFGAGRDGRASRPGGKCSGKAASGPGKSAASSWLGIRMSTYKASGIGGVHRGASRRFLRKQSGVQFIERPKQGGQRIVAEGELGGILAHYSDVAPVFRQPPESRPDPPPTGLNPHP